MPSPGYAPRRSAVFLLDQVTIEKHLLSELLPHAVERLEPDDRARAARLAISTLRWMDRADRMLGPHLNNRPPISVLNVLRLAVVELCHDKAAAHGVVNSAVDIVRADKDYNRMSGMVNAVLRNIVRTDPAKWDGLPQPQMPKWLRKPLIADYKKHAVADMEAGHAAGAPLDITVKTDVAGWAKKLGGAVLPTGSIRMPRSHQVTALEGFDTGDWWIQDTAASLPVRILAPKSGERILDLCAAPGGKTMQLAAAGADVTALDQSKTRMARVEENLKRTNLSAKIVVSDALKYEAEAFDAILLDAPCSATGTIRRHPDLPYAKDGEEFPKLFKLQEAMIDSALKLLKPGGRLVFCTCSLLIDEGEEQIKDMLVRHPNLTIDLDALAIAGVNKDWIGECGLRTRPDYMSDLGGMDGFFISMVRKP